MRRKVIILLGALILFGCGGHGGGSSAAAPTPVTLQFQPTDLTFDAQKGMVFATTATSDQTYMGDVVGLTTSPVRVTTDIRLQTFPLTFIPTTIAASQDGTTLFVAGKFTNAALDVVGALDEIPLSSTNTPGASPVTLPGGNMPMAITTDPAAPLTVAVSLGSSSSDLGTTIFDSMVARPNPGTIGQSVTFNSAGTQLYGLTQASEGFLTYAISAVSPIGLGHPTTATTNEQGGTGYSDGIHYLGTKIVTDQGDVLDPATGTFVGSFDLPTGTQHVAVPGLDGNTVYYVAWPSGGGPAVEVLTFSLKNLRELGTPATIQPTVLGPVVKGVCAGSGTIVFFNQSAKVVVVTGLP